MSMFLWNQDDEDDEGEAGYSVEYAKIVSSDGTVEYVGFEDAPKEKFEFPSNYREIHYIDPSKTSAAADYIGQTVLQIYENEDEYVIAKLLKRANRLPDEQTIQPPKRGEQALLLILSKEEREYLVGDLAEEFAEISTKHGKEFATVWYWKQVFGSLRPLIWKVLRLGLFTWAEEWVRRRF